MTRALTAREVRAMFDATDRADYNAGYKAGHADKLLGRASIIAQTSKSEPYRVGYLNGQLDTNTLEP